eukprot:76866-Rhodomonas_salina.1
MMSSGPRRTQVDSAICLRACYAMPGTEQRRMVSTHAFAKVIARLKLWAEHASAAVCITRACIAVPVLTQPAQSMVIDEDERGGGGKERQRDKVRKFKYKTRDGGGDLYVKVLFTGDKLDMRGNDEKEDDMGKR